MAVPKKKCSACNKSMNAELRRCPSCGKDQKPYLNYLIYIGAIALVFVFFTANDDKSNSITTPTIPTESDFSSMSSFFSDDKEVQEKKAVDISNIFTMFSNLLQMTKAPEKNEFIGIEEILEEQFVQNVSLEVDKKETESLLGLFFNSEAKPHEKISTKNVKRVVHYETDFTIVSGQTGKVNLGVGVSHTWKFKAKKGQFITVAMGAIGESTIRPKITLISPEGEKLGSDSDNYGAMISNITAPVDGTYAVLCNERSGNREGEYTVSLALSGTTVTLSKDDEGGNIKSGQTIKGTLNLGDLDIWTFNATKGQFLTVSMGQGQESTIRPGMILAAPDGTKLGSNADNYGARVSDINAPETGLYTIILFERSNNRIGDYTVSLSAF